MNKTEQIEIFTTGMTTDLRKIIRLNRHIYRPFQSLQHFDVYPDRLVPKRDWVLDTVATTNLISKFTFFDDGSGGYTLWGLGLDGSNHVQLLKKSGDAFTGTWNSVANGVTSSVGTVGQPWIFGYKSYIYFMTSSGLARYNVSTNVMSESWQSVSGATAAPVIHPRTGAAYFFFANSVYEVDPTSTWVGIVQTLPANMAITSAVPLGNNLAIGAAPLNGYDNSTTYLWDLTVTSAVTSINFSESIDWGKGDLKHLANLYGTLVGVSNERIDHNDSLNKGRMITRMYKGSVADDAGYITADAIASTPIASTYFRDGERLFFPASVPFKTDNRIGIWAIDASGNYTIDAIGPAAEATHRIIGLFRLGKAWFVTFDDNNVYRMNDQASFTTTSILETAVYGDRSNSSQFFGATVSFEALTAGQSVTMKYKFPEDTAWQLMGTQSTVGQRQLQVLGTSLKVAPRFSEYQFRIESVGAILTGVSWTVENFDTNIYG